MDKTKTVLITVLCLLLLAVPLTFAGDGDIVKMQGVVMWVDRISCSLVVNEKVLHWGPQTFLGNDKGLPVEANRLQPKQWVYIEGVKDRSRKTLTAAKIYIIPKHIHEKEKHLYSFMESP